MRSRSAHIAGLLLAVAMTQGERYVDQAVVTELGFKFDTAQPKKILADAGYTDRNGDGLVEASLEAVRLDPAHALGKYSHQLSGGQLQRLLIAGALLLDIKLLVAERCDSR
jgi:ABC-type oligopeptide transport system ATPase subunit